MNKGIITGIVVGTENENIILCDVDSEGKKLYTVYLPQAANELKEKNSKKAVYLAEVIGSMENDELGKVIFVPEVVNIKCIGKEEESIFN